MAGGLKDHIKVVHLNIREYRCDECGYECTTRSNLRKHLIMMSHSSKRPINLYTTTHKSAQLPIDMYTTTHKSVQRSIKVHNDGQLC